MPHPTRGRSCWFLLCGLLLLAAAGCGDSTPAAPTALTAPSLVAPPAPAPAPPYKVTGLTGVYDFSATVETFDPVWGDLTGYRFSGVLTLEDGAGELSELRGFDAAGEPGSAPPGGPVMARLGYEFPEIVVVGRLVGFVVESIDAPAGGQTASPRFTGRFGTGNPTGPFVPVRRRP